MSVRRRLRRLDAFPDALEGLPRRLQGVPPLGRDREDASRATDLPGLAGTLLGLHETLLLEADQRHVDRADGDVAVGDAAELLLNGAAERLIAETSDGDHHEML